MNQPKKSSIPSELQQLKAYKFYQKRIKSGYAESSETDWNQAGEYVTKASINYLAVEAEKSSYENFSPARSRYQCC